MNKSQHKDFLTLVESHFDKRQPSNQLESQIINSLGLTNSKRRQTNRLQWFYPAAAMILLLLGAFILFQLFSSTNQPLATAIDGNVQISENKITTGTDQKGTVKLYDNTTVELAPNTEINVEKPDNARSVNMTNGNAIFNVEKKDKEFKVKTSLAEIHVLGTKFQVNLQKGGTDMKALMTVIVLSGLVEVSNSVDKVTAKAGDIVQVEDNKAPTKKIQDDKTKNIYEITCKFCVEKYAKTIEGHKSPKCKSGFCCIHSGPDHRPSMTGPCPIGSCQLSGCTKESLLVPTMDDLKHAEEGHVFKCKSCVNEKNKFVCKGKCKGVELKYCLSCAKKEGTCAICGEKLVKKLTFSDEDEKKLNEIFKKTRKSEPKYWSIADKQMPIKKDSMWTCPNDKSLLIEIPEEHKKFHLICLKESKYWYCTHHNSSEKLYYGPRKLPKEAIELLDKKLKKAEISIDEIKKLIEQLDNDDPEKREEATQKLIKIGKQALPLLQEATKSKNPEVKEKAIYIIEQIKLNDFEEAIRLYSDDYWDKNDPFDTKKYEKFKDKLKETLENEKDPKILLRLYQIQVDLSGKGIARFDEKHKDTAKIAFRYLEKNLDDKTVKLFSPNKGFNFYHISTNDMGLYLLIEQVGHGFNGGLNLKIDVEKKEVTEIKHWGNTR